MPVDRSLAQRRLRQALFEALPTVLSAHPDQDAAMRHSQRIVAALNGLIDQYEADYQRGDPTAEAKLDDLAGCLQRALQQLDTLVGEQETVTIMKVLGPDGQPL
jgi:hypothetical protein